jgi:hypothetical protein
VYHLDDDEWADLLERTDDLIQCYGKAAIRAAITAVHKPRKRNQMRNKHTVAKFTVRIYRYAPTVEILASGNGSSERVAAMRAVESLARGLGLTGNPVTFEVIKNR